MTTLEQDEFAKHLNTTFRVLQIEPPLDLQLIEVSDVKHFPGQESFSIVFQGPGNNFLPQGINEFHHEVIGDFAIFTVPIREDSNGFYYEAIFSRLIDEDPKSK
jgi:hypothetical protein